jgi:hypothetical protein
MLRPGETLKPCWFCGEKVNLYCKSYIFEKLYKTYTYRARCNICFTSTSWEISRNNILVVWNTGEVRIPIHVDIPKNHYVSERTRIGQTTIMALMLPNRHAFHGDKILKSFKERLSVVLDGDDNIRPHIFKLVEERAQHLDAKLLKIVREIDYTTFYFECNRTIFYITQKNKSDTAWIATPVAKAPVLNKVFEILSKES